LLVIDVIMPKMSGTALAKQVHTFRPDLPVLFISGVLAEEIVLSQQPRPKEAYLPKPITNEQLLGITRRLLAAHPA
jgi:two-component system cell cycle sensor histidine kinase/response regulator CckA